MPDFPSAPAPRPFGTVSTHDAAAGPLGEAALVAGLGPVSTGTWPATNLAIYMPVTIERAVTAFQIGIVVATQSGNADVGIYAEDGTRLVSSGSTAVGAAGFQAFDIADTALPPGTYFLAMACSSATAVFRRFTPAPQLARCCGVKQQATALPLPATATFAVAGQGYCPWVSFSTVATI